MNNIADRVYQFAEKEGINISEFSKRIGVSNGYFAKQKANNSSIGSHIIEKIVREFPSINTSWLLTGEGNMYDSHIKESQKYLSNINEIEPAEQFSKAFTWLICSSYAKKNNTDFPFNSFSELSEIFALSSNIIKLWQETLEADIFSEVVLMGKSNLEMDEEGNFIVNSSVEKILDKYLAPYEKLKTISIELMTLLENMDIMKEVLRKKT